MSTQDSKTIAIKCTNCAAPLKILGGGRVNTITCSYCNSLLDLNDHYKVLTQFHSKYRPPTPLSLGMKGTIKGTEWTIIGWVAYKTTDFPTERWSEFFLYSPYYGYAWLVYEEGEILYSRRVRDFSLREWQDKRNPKTIFYKSGHYIAKEGSYLAEIDFVQGELTWIARAGDTVRCWDYDGVRRKSISIEKTKDEYEVYLNEKLDTKKIYESFGVAREKRVNPKQSISDKIFDEGSLDATEKSFSAFARGLMVLIFTLLMVIVFSKFSSKTLVYERTNQPYVQTFTVSSDAFLSEIKLKAPTASTLDAYRLVLYKSNNKILSIDKTAIYPHNSNFRYTWKANSDNEIEIYLKLTQGFYRVSLEHITPMKSIEQVTLSIKERVVRLLYILPLFVIMLIMMLPAINRHYFDSKQKGKFWWILVAGIGFYFFGIVVPIALGVMYMLTSSVRESMYMVPDSEEDMSIKKGKK